MLHKNISAWCSAHGSQQVSMVHVAEGWVKLDRRSHVNRVRNIGDLVKGMWFILHESAEVKLMRALASSSFRFGGHFSVASLNAILLHSERAVHLIK